MANDLEFIRDSLREIKTDVRDLHNSIGKVYDKLDAHEKECPAYKAYLKKSTMPPSSKIPWWNLLLRLGPFILAAAIGLLGIGAYLGSHQGVNDVQTELAKMKKTLEDAR